MNSKVNFVSAIRCTGLLVFCATMTLAASALVFPAHAASDYLLEIDEIDGEAAVIEKDLCDKSKQAQELIDSITADYQALQALAPEFASLGDQLLKVRKQGEEQHDFMVLQLQDAQKIFSDQIGPLLDASVSDQVAKDLGARLQKAIADGDTKTAPDTEELSQVQDMIDSMADEVSNLAKISAITARFGKCVATDSGDFKY